MFESKVKSKKKTVQHGTTAHRLLNTLSFRTALLRFRNGGNGGQWVMRPILVKILDLSLTVLFQDNTVQ